MTTKPTPPEPAPAAAARTPAQRYLDLWERHVSLGATGAPYPEPAPETGPRETP